jgi:hypothetical protein
MLHWFKQLDGILRGDATQLSALERGRIDMPIGGVMFVALLLAMIYGVCMGAYAIIRTAWSDTGVTDDAVMQMIASAVKLPLLFLLTLVVTFPSLYVFNALVGSRLSLTSVARLLVAMIGVMMAVLASLGPIVVFFSASTSSYPFMKLLNVAAATVAGVLGLAFLLRTLSRLVMVQSQIDYPVAESSSNTDTEELDGDDELQTASALDPIRSHTDAKATAVFKIWVVVFAVVGAQMSWVLRPFIGSPDMEFTWFRERNSSFFLEVLSSITELFGG